MSQSALVKVRDNVVQSTATLQKNVVEMVSDIFEQHNRRFHEGKPLQQQQQQKQQTSQPQASSSRAQPQQPQASSSCTRPQQQQPPLQEVQQQLPGRSPGTVMEVDGVQQKLAEQLTSQHRPGSSSGIPRPQPRR